MKINPKILLACPVSQHKEYCLWEWLEKVKQITSFTQNIDVLLVDNSADNTFFERIKDAGFNCIHVRNSGKNSRDLLAESWNVIRDYVLANNYEYHFSLECDLFPPADIISRLLAHAEASQLPVVAAPYFIELGERSTLMIQEIDNIGLHKTQLTIPQFSGFMKVDGKLQRIVSPGQGCVLIHRQVYKYIHFRIGTDRAAHPDTYFFYDLYRFNIPVHLDTSLIIEHKNRNWSTIPENYN